MRSEVVRMAPRRPEKSVWREPLQEHFESSTRIVGAKRRKDFARRRLSGAHGFLVEVHSHRWTGRLMTEGWSDTRPEAIIFSPEAAAEVRNHRQLFTPFTAMCFGRLAPLAVTNNKLQWTRAIFVWSVSRKL